MMSGVFLKRVGVVVCAAGASGCSGTEPEAAVTTLTDEQFVTTYVELRIRALLNPDGEILPEQRDSILADQGVQGEDLVEFAEVHGRRAVYMQAVWDSIEVRYQRRRDELNSGSAAPSNQS